MKSRKRGDRRSKNSSRADRTPSKRSGSGDGAAPSPSDGAAQSPGQSQSRRRSILRSGAPEQSQSRRPRRCIARTRAGQVLTTNQGTRGQRQPEHAEGGRARSVAPRGLPLPREDHPLRPRADPRARRACARHRRARLLPGLRRSLARYTKARVPAGSVGAHAGLRALLDGRRLARLDRHGARRPRLRGQVLHGGGRTSTSSATTSRSSSSRTRSSSPTSIHAVKPEPDNEMPQAASAHDTFWDFISLMPESMHMIMWVMSDRAIPRSFRMMEGFGVHTFRFVNAEGTSRFVKFHWKPLLGVHSVVWDEAQKISGKDPDFHRRDLWEAIEQGDFPRVRARASRSSRSGRARLRLRPARSDQAHPRGARAGASASAGSTLNRNPDNFFAETEQVAFHPGHVVPGIDFTNDPLLQGRLFSYTDTQLMRLGGPNFHEIPINRPIAPVHNNQRDGHMRQTINRGKADYEPNSIGGGCPMQARSRGRRLRHASRSRLEGDEGAGALREVLRSLQPGDAVLQQPVGAGEGPHRRGAALRARQGRAPADPRADGRAARARRPGAGRRASPKASASARSPRSRCPSIRAFPGTAIPADFEPRSCGSPAAESPALSMANTVKEHVATRKVAILAADGVDGASVGRIQEALLAEGAARLRRRPAARHARRPTTAMR